MPAAAVAIRFILHGLVAMGLYAGYQYYSSPSLSPVLSTPLSDTDSLSFGSLGSGVTLADGRASISRRTVAVADLHGDLQHAINVLSMAKIVSPDPKKAGEGEEKEWQWVGGHDVLVSTGDIVDRGDDTMRFTNSSFLSEPKRSSRGER